MILLLNYTNYNMKNLCYTLLSGLLFLACTPLHAQIPNTVKSTFEVKITDGVCSFHGIKIGSKIDDVEKAFGKTALISQEGSDDNPTFYFYPDYGLKFGLEGEYVRSIFLYPIAGSVMGDISKFHIFSRNQSEWKYKNMSMKAAKPQDVMQLFGTENMNTRIGSGITSAISNNVMGFKVVNSGGTQELIFYYDGSKEDTLEHIANRLGKS